MAVSGRKLSDFQGSVCRGSADNFDESCVPCLSVGQHIEAHGFCVDCQEYLCKNCFHCHKKTKASRDHKLLDEADIDKLAPLPKLSDVCSEKCSIHRNEIIKFFCPKHEELGCHDCMTMEHRTCDLDYIPDKCKEKGNSEEYVEIVKELKVKIKEAEAVIRKAAVKDKEVDDGHDKFMKDVLKFRKEINDHLDMLQTKIEAEAIAKKSANKQKTQTALASCQDFTSNLQKLHTNLQTCKETNQNGQLFIDMKRAKYELQSKAVQQANIWIDKTNLQYIFLPNKGLGDAVSLDSFGKLVSLLQADAVPSNTLSNPREVRLVSMLIYKNDININTISDQSTCDMSGCAVLPPNKLVLTDLENEKLKVIDTENGEILEELKLDSNPRDISVLQLDQIAVTLPHKREILIINTAGRLSVDHSIYLKEMCFGIIYHQDSWYVSCQDPKSVLILDMKGAVRNKILLDNNVFCNPVCVVPCQDQNRLYISENGNNSIVCISLKGDILAEHKNVHLTRPTGLQMLIDGSLLVCSTGSNSIVHISADLKESRIVRGGLDSPRSICINKDRDEVYIGEEESDVLKVFRLI